MALFHQMCSIPIARAARSRSLTIPSQTIALASVTKKLSVGDPHVLLGMSEEELQQVAVDLGQEKYRGKQLHHLLFKRKAKDYDDFRNLPLAFRKLLQESGWKIGRSPIHRAVTAADGTIKGVQIGQRMMTISTVGVLNTIKKLASHKL